MSWYIGAMKIEGQKHSFKNGIDIFKTKSNHSSTDHIWPVNRNGSNLTENIQKLTVESNNLKQGNVKGFINNIRYVILMNGEDDFGKVIGTMYISYDDGISWWEVIKDYI